MHKKIYLSVILGILFFVSCKDKKQYYEESGTVFHTLYTIKYEAVSYTHLTLPTNSRV